jgi:hypothetical protein
METIKDLLRQRQHAEPAEVGVIKVYVRKQFQSEVGVTVQDKTIVISVPGAALAGSLRPHLYNLKNLCRTDKRLIIRIS